MDSRRATLLRTALFVVAAVAVFAALIICRGLTGLPMVLASA